MYDAAIVGSGPAGACAAFELARHGVKVVVLEKMDLPRYKTCGGGVVRRAQNLLPVDITPISERQFTSATMNFLESGLSFQASREEPLITMTMRSALDHLLVSHAEKAGAKISPKTRVVSLTRTCSSIRLATSEGPLAARFVIGADGVHSIVARSAGWADNRILAPALESEIQVPDDDFLRYSATVRFDFDIPEHGYAWVFPKRNHLSVGVLTLERRDRNLNNALQKYLRAVGLQRIIDEQRHGYLVPMSVRAPSLAADRVLLVGDAAGFADPVTAEGISHAIESGQMAAKALTKTELEAGKAEALYNDMVREHLYPELRAARLLSVLLYNSPRLRLWLFKHYGPHLVNAMADILTGKRNYRGTLVDWRSYLKLLRPSATTS